MANWASIDRLGNPADAAWQRDNLVTIEPVPGQRWQVYREAAPSYQGFLSELAATGYPLASSGGFNYRNIRGSDRLSQHAFGTAIDLNAAANPRVAPGGAVVTDLPASVGELAAKYGLEWGGNWKRPDAMHFEWSGKDAGSTPSIGSMYASAAPTPAAAPAGPVANLAPQATALMSGGVPTPGGAQGNARTAGPALQNLAAMFMQGQQMRQQQREEEQAAEQERRTALLSGGLAGMYG